MIRLHLFWFLINKQNKLIFSKDKNFLNSSNINPNDTGEKGIDFKAFTKDHFGFFKRGHPKL